MSSDLVAFTVNIAPWDSEPDESIDAAARALLAELLDSSSVATADLARSGPAPAGSKVADPVTLGALAITAITTGLPPFIQLIKDWALRSEGRRVNMKAQIGDRLVELSYNPAVTTEAAAKSFVDNLLVALRDVRSNKGE